MSEEKKHTDKDVSDAAKKLGHLGGIKGGVQRAKKLSAEERSEIARKGGKAHALKQGLKGKKLQEKKKKHKGEGE